MSNYNAHQSPMDSKEQVILDAHKERRTALVREEVLRKQRVAELFWRKVYWTCMALFAIIIIYSIIKFTGA
jgi:hypothetical protein